MRHSSTNRQRLWWRFISRLALALAALGIAAAVYAGLQGHISLMFLLGWVSAVALMAGWFQFGMSLEMMTAPFGLDGPKENRPFPVEFERSPDSWGQVTVADTISGERGCNFWYSDLGIGLQFGWPFEGKHFGMPIYRGPRVLITRDELLAIFRDSLWNYRIDHRNAELRSPLWVPWWVGSRLQKQFPERVPGAATAVMPSPAAIPTKPPKVGRADR